LQKYNSVMIDKIDLFDKLGGIKEITRLANCDDKFKCDIFKLLLSSFPTEEKKENKTIKQKKYAIKFIDKQDNLTNKK